jgi:hypothetical protein
MVVYGSPVADSGEAECERRGVFQVASKFIPAGTLADPGRRLS